MARTHTNGLVEVLHRAEGELESLIKEGRKLARHHLVKKAQRDLQHLTGEVLAQTHAREFAAIAKDQVLYTRDHLLHILDIPTHKDISSLHRKLKVLEQRVHSLHRHRAA